MSSPGLFCNNTGFTLAPSMGAVLLFWAAVATPCGKSLVITFSFELDAVRRNESLLLLIYRAGSFRQNVNQDSVLDLHNLARGSRLNCGIEKS